MFRKRYRTTHDTSDTIARAMRILKSINSLQQKGIIVAYNVVKFIVKVRLVEKSLNSKVGRVMEVNVTTQYRTAGMSRARSNARTPKTLNHDTAVVPSCAVAAAVASDEVELEAVLTRELGAVMFAEASPWTDASMVGQTVGYHAACWLSRGVRIDGLLVDRIMVAFTNMKSNGFAHGVMIGD